MKAELIIDAPIINKKEIWIKKVNQPHFDHPFHFHQFCELVWVEKSYGKLIVGDYAGVFSEGDLIMEGPELPHLWRCDDIFYKSKKNLHTKAFGLYFPPTLIPNITDDAKSLGLFKGLLNNAQRGLRFYGKTREKIIELFKKIINSEGLERMGYFLRVIHILNKTSEFEFLASIGYANRFNSKHDMNRFNEVYQFLLTNFHREILLIEVAKICHMTPTAFCRFFKIRTQKTFIRFLNEIRIGQACKLLQNDDQAIKDIYVDCGYNNPVNFFKFFKLITGKTPKEYRDNIKMMNKE
ncbi:MAG: AraC family transcriptional regulator [Chitinophagaceae bacterium]